MEQLIKNRTLKLSNSPNVADCRMCNKNIVCTLYRGLNTLLGNWEGDAKPFQPENTAMICKYYSVEYKENL
jgi:hypothetical protein